MSARLVQHIAFNCRDMAAQEAFYTKHFGFNRARVFERGTPNEFVMLRLGATCLEFFQTGDDAKVLAGGEQAVGFKHLAFEVPDIPAAVAALKKDGIEPGPVIDCGSIVEGMSVCFFDDPEGNIVELMHGFRDELPGSSDGRADTE